MVYYRYRPERYQQKLKIYLYSVFMFDYKSE